MKNRIISLTLSFVILASLIPAGIASVSVTAGGSEDPLPIEFVEIFGFHPPVVGETAGENLANVCTFDDAQCAIKSLSWYTEKDGKNCVLESFDVFEEGEFYWLEICVIPVGNNSFFYSNQPEFQINNSGNYVDGNWMMYIEEDGSIAFYTVSLCSEAAGGMINTVDIYGVFYPYADESVGYNRESIYITESSHCTIESVTWNRYPREGEEESVAMGDDDTFAAGDTCWLYFILKPDKDYFFESYDLPALYINESTDYVNTSTMWVDNDGNLRFSSVEFCIADIYGGIEIESIEIEGFTLPCAGDKIGDNLASLFTPDDAPYFLMDTCWDDGVVILAHGDVFEPGTEYSLTFYIMPSEGYHFKPLHLDITLNGSDTYVHGTYNVEPDGTLVCYTIDIEAESAAEYIVGDMDGDGNVDSDDAVHLLRYTLFPEYYYILQPGDMNNDGYVTSDDAVYLLRHTLFPEFYPL